MLDYTCRAHALDFVCELEEPPVTYECGTWPADFEQPVFSAQATVVADAAVHRARYREPSRGEANRAASVVLRGLDAWPTMTDVSRRWPKRVDRGVRALAVLALLGTSSCAGPNLWTDLTSVSTGRTNQGRIRKPAQLSRRGPGWVVPPRWKERGFQYGVDELVEAVQRGARRVNARDRRAVLGVADLSRKTGGRSIWHKSHHSGRDVDLLFYTTDTKGRPMKPPEHDMIRFDAEGQPFVGPKDERGYLDARWQERRFDTARNWQLLEALLTDPSIRLQWIFVSKGLKAKLLTHATQVKRPRWIVEYADAVIHQPGDSLPHDDHFHIRIYCTRADRFHGCEDRGVVWQHEKKTFKYGGPERYDPVLWQLVLGRTSTLL